MNGSNWLVVNPASLRCDGVKKCTSPQREKESKPQILMVVIIGIRVASGYVTIELRNVRLGPIEASGNRIRRKSTEPCVAKVDEIIGELGDSIEESSLLIVDHLGHKRAEDVRDNIHLCAKCLVLEQTKGHLNVQKVVEHQSDIHRKWNDLIHIRRNLVGLDLTECVVDAIDEIGVNANAKQVVTFVVKEEPESTSVLFGARNLKRKTC